MSFDEMYDEMLHDEFRSLGKHASQAAAVEPEPVESESMQRARHAAADDSVDEVRPRGFQRYRTAALVGAGGMACAAAGAFLGGLGGYFTISPAAAHPVASSQISDLPIAQAVDHAAGSANSSSGAKGTAAVAAAAFSKVSGSLTEGLAPFQSLTSDPLQNLPLGGIPGVPGTTAVTSTGGGTDNGGGGGGGGGGGTGGGTGCVSESSDLGLTCILQSLTSALSNLGSLGTGNPAGLLSGLVPTLTGVVSDVQGTLDDLTSLLPTGGVVPTTVLASNNPTTGAPATTGAKSSSSSPSSVVSALAPVLNSVGAVASGLTGGSTPSLPSLPLLGGGSGGSLPSLPVTTPSGSTPAPPTVSTPIASSSGGSNTINVPIPLPLPINVPTLSIGGLSVGINTTDSGSGLTLTLP